MRDYKNIKAYQLADSLVLNIYKATQEIEYLTKEEFKKIEEARLEASKTLYGLICAVAKEV
ncbi:MAG: hypothetical protein WC522_02495 [Candidatus Omnitrophota bacterium]